MQYNFNVNVLHDHIKITNKTQDIIKQKFMTHIKAFFNSKHRYNTVILSKLSHKHFCLFGG